ncbi:hypothetical protein, partial [Xanthomonas axonopodis]|uniref:hypothetical protein n=1 Tax=Xanthomonas axonopodis TaxID=53413 RepID=UPI001ADC3BED
SVALSNELLTGWHGCRAARIERCTNRLGLPIHSGHNTSHRSIDVGNWHVHLRVKTANVDVEHRPHRRGGCVAIPLLAASVAMLRRQHRYS